MGTNIVNVKSVSVSDFCVYQATPKQHLKLNFSKKLSNTKAKLKKGCLLKKSVHQASVKREDSIFLCGRKVLLALHVSVFQIRFL